MSIIEFKIKTILITRFKIKLNRETVPLSIQKIFMKKYAATLDINLTDKMIEFILISDKK